MNYTPEACFDFIADNWANRARTRSGSLPYDEWREIHIYNSDRVSAWMDGLLDAYQNDELDLTSAAVCTAVNWARIWFKCRDEEQIPSIECFALTPEQARAHGVGYGWWICWEAGPSDWGICVDRAEFNLITPHDGCWFEPYWGFDISLCE